MVIDRDGVIWFIGYGVYYDHMMHQTIKKYEGNSWTTYTTDNSDLPSDLIYSIAVDKNNKKWIGTNSGVARFDGVTWTTFTKKNSGLIDDKINAIAVEKNNTIWFGTDNGVSKYTGEVITTFVDEKETKPEALVVIKTYPNPFNPAMIIEFDLPNTGIATLTIYNIADQKVRELLSGYKSAGMHSIVWNGTDESGNTVSAGVYIARLKAGEVIATGKIVLVR